MKIHYGIHMGINSASIAKMQNGTPEILRSHTLKDTMPVCVYFNRRGVIQVGDSAFNTHRKEIADQQNGRRSTSNNSFIEFTRTLGTDALYHSTIANKSFRSEELVAEVIKVLRSFERDQDINAAVITIPDAFKINQIDAIRQAGKLAGLEQVEVLQESIAASMAFGLDSVKYQGFSLVFSFDDDFNVSLIKDGHIIDNQGDNYLGANNLDFAIVDEIILPYIQENFVIDSIMKDDTKMQRLRNSLKYYAKDAKEKLSFNDTHTILSILGDLPGEDDEGEEFELDITISQADISRTLSPVLQKAIDLSKNLLERNNLKGSSLDSLALVGGSTFSPVLRKMLEEQICKPNTSIDPKTAIVKGAALYASTVDVSEEVREQTRDKAKIQLELGYESITAEEEEFVTIKILEDKTEGDIPETVFADISRGDGGWSSGKVEINTYGEVFTVPLEKGKSNSFTITLHDGKGTKLKCEPSNFKILHTHEGHPAVLPYNIGIELQDKRADKSIFRTIKGLEKSKILPAKGIFKYKTTIAIRPGVETDYINIPIYQGEHGCEGTRTIHNHHVSTFLITGNDLPSLLPENSEVNIELKVDVNQHSTGTAYFPHLAHTHEFECETKVDSVNESKADYLVSEISKAKSDINSLKSNGVNSSDAFKIEKEIEEIENNFNKNKESPDIQQQAIENLRKALKKIDKLICIAEWPILESKLRNDFFILDELAKSLNNDNISQIVVQYNIHLNEVFRSKDIKQGNILLDEIIREISRINAINEKYDREYLQLYENGKMTLTELKKSLEDANRQNGIVYQEVLNLISKEESQFTKNQVEALLFKLTEEETLPGNKFGEYYERLSIVDKNSSELVSLYKEIKEYE